MAHVRSLPVLLAALLLLAGPALAAPPPPEPAMLELWNRPIVEFRKQVGVRSPADRAALAAARIGAVPLEVARGDVTIAEFKSE